MQWNILIHPNAVLSSSLRRLRRRCFGISVEETSFARRKFWGGEATTQQRLEQIGRTFLYGYHTVLEDDDLNRLQAQLQRVEPDLRGFAFEGAAMALVLLDGIMPWERRFQAFLQGPGAPHIYMAHVGAGWAFARLHRRFDRALQQLDPLLGWLAVDGYGFHEGYFNWPHAIQQQVVPRQLSGYARRVFDQGLGRSLWFVAGGDVTRIIATIASFAPTRHADLWSGVGLACTYAGGVEPAAIAALRDAAGDYAPQLAQGATFAAKTRQRAGNLTDHTETACMILCHCSADEAASITDRALEQLPANGTEPAYELWRQRIQSYVLREARI